MSEYVYVDNSNVFIEGKRVSAVEKGYALNIWDAIENRILDNEYRLDFWKLHTFSAGDDLTKIKRAVLFGSRPPQNDLLWEFAKRVGFETVIEDRNLSNREKKIDTAIVAAMTRDAYKMMNPVEDRITLVAGDADYVPAIHSLKNDGYTVDVFFWGHASRELKQTCSAFVSLDPYLHELEI
jgi:uncharacterized LabA/DUF88 family protein